MGEACHFIDFLRYLVRYPVVDVQARMIGSEGGAITREDKMVITLGFADGSLGTIQYFANGNRRFAKERIEAFSDGRVLVLDNFRTLRGYGWPGAVTRRSWRQDKGHRTEILEFVGAVADGGKPLIEFAELEEVTLSTFLAVESASRDGSNGNSVCQSQSE